jgi:Ca-activated chloride channel family protein
MKRHLWLVGFLFTVLNVFADGFIVIYPIHPIVPPEPWPHPSPRPREYAFAPLEVTYHRVNTRIRSQMAVTSIDQEFYNPNNARLEGTYMFPVPKGAQISKFTMEINGKAVEAELMDADKARGIYEEIVRKIKDPALLEYAGQDLFKARIFPIEPHEKKRISLSYSQMLRSDSGLVTYLYPLNTEKFSAKPLKNVSVKVEIESKQPLKSIYSPSHSVEVKRHGANQATVGFEAADVKPDTDFQVIYSEEKGDIGANLMTFREGSEDGFFTLLMSPGVDIKNEKIIPKDVAFVLDTSGSMAGDKLKQAKKALAFCIENLNDGDRFEIIRFSTEAEPLFNKLVEANGQNRSKASDFVKDLKPIGGTAIDEALQKAVGLREEKSDRPYVVIFLTDGQPTVGNTVEDQIVSRVTKAADRPRIFCFGIGSDVNTHLLDKITEETHAFSQYVLPTEDIEVKVSSFYTKIKEPVLTNLKLKVDGDIKVSKMYPSALPDVFKGDQLVITGRYTGWGDARLLVEGTVNGQRREFPYKVQFAEKSAEYDFIPRLWATRRIGYLLDENRLRGENKELRDEIVELARKYGIVTPYTSYLIVEDEARRDVPVAQRSLQMMERNSVAREEAAKIYTGFKDDRVGDGAVAGARSYNELKGAAAPAPALAQSNAETFRYSTAKSPSRASSRGGESVSMPELVQATRYVNGRNFFQNGTQWIDSTAQKMPKAKVVEVRFNSDEYFALLKKHPYARAWLALGQNVQVVLGDTIYDIKE